MSDTTITDEPMATYIKRFRGKILDNDPLKNILNNQQLQYDDPTIAGWITESWYFINETPPSTSYQLVNFPQTTLLLDGAMMMMLEGQGLLHLRNQISYSDAGFSVNLDDKAGYYAQWLAQKATMFLNGLKQFKRSKAPRMRGLWSPMGWY